MSWRLLNEKEIYRMSEKKFPTFKRFFIAFDIFGIGENLKKFCKAEGCSLLCI